MRNSTGGFTKEDFTVDLDAGTVTCPARHTVPVHFGRGGEGKASFKGHCPLKASAHLRAVAHDIGPPPRGATAPAAPSRKARSDKPIINQRAQ